MRACVCRLAATAAFMLVVNAAAAQDKIRIGLIYTLSGAPSTLGQQSKNGFELALKNLGGKMGGKDVELVVADDELKPDVAIQKVRGLLERDRVDFVVGPIFSNILVAIHKPVIDAGKILISTNAGTSNFAGAGCNANFFVTSYQNDQIFEAVGEASNKLGYKRVYILVPNYPAGKDAIAGFKRTYKGRNHRGIASAPEHDRLRSGGFQDLAAKPDALFTFMPGGLGINLLNTYIQAGLKGKIPIVSTFTADEATLPVLKDNAVDVYGVLTWAPNMDNPANKKFVSEYEAAYNAVPASYAMQAYDAAMLINSAVSAVNGNLADQNAVRAALKKAAFTSVRGPFKFNINGYPIEDFYLTKVAKRADGKYETQIVEKIFSNHADGYAKDCKL